MALNFGDALGDCEFCFDVTLEVADVGDFGSEVTLDFDKGFLEEEKRLLSVVFGETLTESADALLLGSFANSFPSLLLEASLLSALF